MIKFPFFLLFLLTFLGLSTIIYGQKNYLHYHEEIIKCETLISEKRYSNAIVCLDSLGSQYEFVFLRDLKMAAQLCAFENDIRLGIKFVKLGILNGWAWRHIENDQMLRIFREDLQWKSVNSDYDSLHNLYLKRINISLQQQVHAMYKKDQKKALGALFRIGQKAQDKYAENKFAPHSQKQLLKLNDLISKHGYPGERLIGNSWWVSVILSHHNSISKDYNAQDTLYSWLKPKLMNALANGELSPYTLATIEDWRTAALNKHNLTSYGFLGTIQNDSVLAVVNKNRAEMGLRSTELRNNLIDIEKETGMDLFLPRDWQKGKITVAESSK